uniref:C-JID domain-containing protein n=1 Tax=Quercus lobata TaxID=97700 RepID=A0A7N2MGI1_QUELO
MATNAIQAIVVNCKEEDCSHGEFSEVFSKMSNLRLLSICHLHSKNTLNRDPNELRYLERECYSLKCLPSGFPPKELVQLDLKYSRIKYLWEGVKILGKLKYINISSSNLIRTPDFSGIPSLEKLRSVPELPASVTYIKAEGCTSLEPLPALLRQSSLSRPPSQSYDESSGGVAFTILNRYLQRLLCRKTGYETSPKRKEDGSKTEFQISIPGFRIPQWLSHQRLGNSMSIKLSPNWCNSWWMGFAICALIKACKDCCFGELDIKVRVRALGDMHHGQYASKTFFAKLHLTYHIWILYLSRDDWFAIVGNYECSQIEVAFFEYHSSFEKVQKCGFSLVYEQDKEESNQAIAQCSSSRVITYEGWDGVHHGFDNSTSSCDDYSDFEPKESGLFSYNGGDDVYAVGGDHDDDGDVYVDDDDDDDASYADDDLYVDDDDDASYADDDVFVDDDDQMMHMLMMMYM